MADYTSLAEYKEFRRPSSPQFLWHIKKIVNDGVTNGDIHTALMKDKCPSGDDYFTVIRICDSTVDPDIYVDFRVYRGSSSRAIWDDALSRLVIDSDILGRDFGFYGRAGVSVSRENAVTFQTKVVKTDHGTETEIWAGSSITVWAGAFDVAWNAGYGQWRIENLLGYVPGEATLTVTFYSQRLYILTKPTETSVDLPNIRYAIINEGHYNYVSYIRDIDAMDHLIEGYTDPEDKKSINHSYYFDNKTIRTNGTVLRSLSGRFKGSGRIAGYITGGEPYNVTLTFSGDLEGQYDDETTWTTVTSLPGLTSNDWLGDYSGILDTNIPIFGEQGDAESYLESGDAENAKNQEDVDTGSKTGKDGTVARFERANTYSIQPVKGCVVYDISLVKNALFTWFADMDSWEPLHALDYFWFGSNPVECIRGFYWTPLDVSQLVSSSSSSQIVSFGGIPAGYDGVTPPSDYIKAPILSYQGNEINLGSYQFARKYNDWRDFECFNYRLYLPFYGLIDLEPFFIAGKRMELKAIYYPTNHMLRYMIFIKKNLYKAVDCSIGIDLPFTGEDVVGKASQTFSDFSGALHSTADTALSKPSSSSIVSSGSSVVSALINTQKKPSIQTWGNTNPTSNIGDPTIPLLYIEEQKSIVPANLHEVYGYKTYAVNKVSSFSGYCEFSDVRISSKATPAEVSMIEEYMKNGIII